MNVPENAPRVVTPEDAAVWATPGWRSPISASFAEDLLHTVATEPDRIRAAVVAALQAAADDANILGADGIQHLHGVDRGLRQRAGAIQNGANWS